MAKIRLGAKALQAAENVRHAEAQLSVAIEQSLGKASGTAAPRTQNQWNVLKLVQDSPNGSGIKLAVGVYRHKSVRADLHRLVEAAEEGLVIAAV